MRNKILLALALSIPVLLFFTAYFFNHSPLLLPTGFIQYDNVSYLAYARQYLDATDLHFQYANPFNESGQYQPIYFQTQTLFFALLLILGIPVAIILPLFSIISAFVCFLLIISIYDHLVPDNKNRTINLLLFSWGGGFLVLAGIVYHYLYRPGIPLSNDLFTIDPEGGWWGLNLGRSLLFSCEAYYHALFLGTIYCMLKKRWITGLVLMFVLTISHPFTGIELALIICSWCFIELYFNRNSLPLWFTVGAVLVTIFHAWYYLVYLEQFPDHRSVSQQYSLTWGLRFYRMIPAYAIVAALAIISVWKASLKNFIRIPSNRLFLSWFLVAFLLANHELFISPKQPIHFTRGYIWTSLFLLGLPTLQQLTSWLNSNKKRILLAGFVLIFLLDNFLWIYVKASNRTAHASTAYITREQKEVFDIVDKESNNQTLIMSTNHNLSYLSTVYSKAYPLYSHPYTTPFAEEKKKITETLFENALMDSSISEREIVFIIEKKDTNALRSIALLPASRIFESPNYMIYKTVNP